MCAADFWQKKKFSEWTQKEVLEMLNNSLWARRVEVVAGVPRSGGGGMREGRAGGRPHGVGVDRQGGGGETGADTSAALPKASLLIRFHAALPIKQAVARARFGDEVLKSLEAEKMLTRKEDAYLIGISGPARLLAGDPSVVFTAAQLVIKGRDPIRAQNVTVDKEERGVTPEKGERSVTPNKGERGLTFYFVFPKGTNPIKLEDEGFELQVKFPLFELKHRFKLKDMAFDGNLEI